MSHPNSGTYEYFTSHGKRHFAEMVMFRILRWNIILNYLAGPSVIEHTQKWKGGDRSDRKREVWPQRSDVACRARRQPFLALKTEEGALSLGNAYTSALFIYF